MLPQMLPRTYARVAIVFQEIAHRLPASESRPVPRVAQKEQVQSLEQTAAISPNSGVLRVGHLPCVIHWVT